jgi:ferric-chelate reductase
MPTTKRQWKAGQHVFIRFLSLRPLQSHPFTIASIEEEGEIMLMIKKEGGFTKALHERVKNGYVWNTRALVDGPYGGPSRDPGAFDSVVLVAGGIGVTFTLPILKDLVRRTQELGKLRCTDISFIWVVRSDNSLEYVEEEIRNCILAMEYGLRAELYFTGSKFTVDKDVMLEPNMTVSYKRPDLAKILKAKNHYGKMCVLGCGPERLTSQLQAEVASLQKSVIKGRDVGEIYVHVETFGW